jgi:chromatin structure-remodeling complex protein RSC7
MNLNGVYDIHTNTMQYPKIMQPTHARWEAVEPLANLTISDSPSSLPPVPSQISNSYLVADILYQNAPFSGLGVPGPDADMIEPSGSGLSAVPQDIVDLLPEKERQAFEEAKAREGRWKNNWGSETEDSMRKALLVDKGLIGG